MSPVVRQCSRLVRLLAVLWAVGRSGGSQPQPSSGVGTALGSDQLLTLIVQRVTANIQPLITKLASRFDGFDARLIGLDTRLNGIETRLNSLRFKQDSFDARLDGLDTRVDELNSVVAGVGSSLGELASEVHSADNRLEARLDKLISRVDELANLTDPRLQPPRDCSELPTGSRSGVHLLKPGLDRSRPPVAAYCDLDTDGGRWTVIQRRADVQPQQNFNLGWPAYREGFGDLEAEFWWGLESLWRLTGSPQHRQYELRVNLADFDGQRRYASYGKFTVASEADGYRLSVGDYTGNAGDSLSHHSGERFSTKDRDHDSHGRRHCAKEYKAGWWFKGCLHCNLNGQYLYGQQIDYRGVYWWRWRDKYSLKETEMKVRPVDTD